MKKWRLSTRVLNLSMQLDWDHWACEHESCSPCAECGGLVCVAGEPG